MDRKINSVAYLVVALAVLMAGVGRENSAKSQVVDLSGAKSMTVLSDGPNPPPVCLPGHGKDCSLLPIPPIPPLPW